MAVNQADTVAYAIATAQTRLTQQTACVAADATNAAATTGTQGSTVAGPNWWAAFSAIGSPPNRVENVEQQNGNSMANMLPNK